MKRIVLFIVFSLIVNICSSQEWFTSFDVAKRLAIVQNKMLFVLWQDSIYDTFPLLANTDSGEVVVVDLAKDTSFDAIIWELFVPVKLSESNYAAFIEAAKGRGSNYLNKLNDNSIKIMDINGNILNVDNSSQELTNLSLLIDSYALDTTFLNSELRNYADEKNFITAIHLATKYVDFGIFTDEKIRPEIMALANIYLNESKEFLSEMNSDKNRAYYQKIELIQIKELLVLNQYKKAYRQIKRIDKNELDTINEGLFTFLNYTVFRLLKDEMNADLWESKISSLDLMKAKLIIKNNKNGSSD